MRIPLLALLVTAGPLAAQDDATTAVVNDTVGVAEAAIERYLAGRDQQPTEVWPQMVCTRMQGEERWCRPSADGRVMPVLEQLATVLELPLARPGRVPACGRGTTPGGLQLRIASLRVAGETAQVIVSLWCMGARTATGNGCRYSLLRLQDRWVVRTGSPVTCFSS